MINIKRITIILISLFLAFSPIIENAQFSYASQDSWEDVVNHSQVCAALKAYAMAEYRISQTFSFGSADPITSAIVGFSYAQWQRIANDAGVSLDDIQNSLKYRIANNGSLQFLYSGSFIQDYNTLIQAYMNKHNLNQADTTRTIYNGEVFTDNDGNSCYISYYNSSSSSDLGMGFGNNAATFENKVITGGTYRFSSSYFTSQTLSNPTEYYFIRYNNANNVEQEIEYKITTQNTEYPHMSSLSSMNNNGSQANSFYYRQYENDNTWKTNYGFVTIIKNTRNNNYYLGTINCVYGNNEGTTLNYAVSLAINLSQNNNCINAIIDASKYGANAAATATGKNAAIEVGKYGANAADAIDNYIKDNEPEEPVMDPDVPVDSEPNLPDPEDPENPDNPNVIIGFPIGGIFANGQFSFQMPDLNNLPNTPHSIPNSWPISGLIHKFPFCIPLDIYAIIDLCDATPQAPRIQGTVDLGAFNYDLDINLSEFDPVMVYVRNFFLMLFCFGLCFITKEILF